MNKKSNLFIDTYNKIDKLLRNELNAEYHESFSYLLKKSKNRIIKQYKKELESLGDLRNAIVHEPRIGGELIADPHPKAVEKLSDIYYKITKPKTVQQHIMHTICLLTLI